ncbi:probable inactive serine/threonine-protein kinase fnkC [Bradysia coprophila]|uniref:probable inactive serine/threonine-protein kinase fnkC n=1 Tax=Bradysia coprophila TaxID=38358 RepID=UPI00187DAAB6|nr:probable inactive serine/threonine-protein kinase fnkC [Bradysia coprophila]
MEVPQLTLRFTIVKIKQKNLFFSEIFELRGLQWQIKVHKRKDALNVYLKSLNKDKSADWSCMASCRVQLISLCRQAYEKSFKSPREFSAKHLSHGFKKFISLKDLFDPAKSYVENNSIVLEVKVKANLPMKLSDDLVKKLTFVRLTIDNINASCGFLSPVFEMSGIPWRIKVYTRKIDKERVMAVMLNCAYSDTKRWSCQAAASFQLKSFDPVQRPHQWQFSKKHKFSRKSVSHGCRSFITWDDLLDEGKSFVRNGSIVFDIEMIVEKTTGIGTKKTTECPICMENLLELPVRTTECGHVFCQFCIERAVTTRNICPTCKEPLLPSQLFPIYLP